MSKATKLRESQPAQSSATAMGAKGRVVVPFEWRASRGWQEGTELIMVNTDEGVWVMSVEEALAFVRKRSNKSVDDFLRQKRRDIQLENKELADWLGQSSSTRRR